ncbi:bifunctional 5-dehydro-2-deoxygluconokinase/5-dehydro-2-deoxyphosphogluconate aldolase [Usitatibacter palustris]|uniref:bifunctional 5-dehydro-2-deoxygluconokinase/5-dehydro-2- deoxyphosphogluconate aldolase n=1 Tax=Usitatibacter palustris TaxID=2732487 RepID=UPI001BB107B4|nr:5-dehydro-2-deoxygluconokinase [Usitatibacter palustris]
MASTDRLFDVACLGRAAVDLYGEQVGVRLENVATFAKYLGGSPANTAVGASRLGLRAAMISRVGNEPNGGFVRETLVREGVDVSQVSTDPERLTALVFLALRDQDTFPHVFYRDRCADMALDASHIDPAFIASCGALLISGTHLSQEGPRAACVKAVAAARAAGTRVILDIDYRPVLWGLAKPAEGDARYVASDHVTGHMQAMLADCALIVGTEEEIRVAGGSGDTLTALAHIRNASKALIVVKRGPMGCVAFDGPIPASLDEGRAGPGFAVEVFNVLGAGDAFMAGFLSGWLRGEPIERCCTYANACGAIVVSRHGCAPAMATSAELAHFLLKGVTTPRLREDRDLEHVHRATTRRSGKHELLYVLAFDHRSQLESVARAHGADNTRIVQFKSLVAQAFESVSRGRAGYGVLLDDRYGASILPRFEGTPAWVARPVEVPGSNPVEFEPGANLGLALRTWPASHVVKCLAFFHPDDPPEASGTQLGRMRDLAEACALTGHELLLEIIPPAREGTADFVVARALDAIYSAGIRPDWWKLPPSADGAAWDAIGASIERHDPLCRGVLVLGMEAGADALRESFAVAARSPWVRGFAVGRSIFADAAADWFAGRASNAQVVTSISARYREVIALWEAAQQGLKESA